MTHFCTDHICVALLKLNIHFHEVLFSYTNSGSTGGYARSELLCSMFGVLLKKKYETLRKWNSYETATSISVQQ